MGIRIDGNNDLINAADGSLTVEGLSIDVTGIVTASGGYKVGSAYTVFSNGNVATAGVVTSTSGVHISGGGRLLVNTASSTAPDGFDSMIQVNAANHEGSITIGRHTANANGPALVFQKSRSGTATPGTGVVSSGDVLGTIRYYGSDGTDRNSYAASISCEIDGTPGSNDMPGRLVFLTTKDGSATSTERLRITNTGYSYFSGNLGIGTVVTSPSTTLHLDSGGTPTTIQIDSDTECSIDFNDHGGSAKRYKIGTNITSNDGQLEVRDMTAGEQRFLIDSDGDVKVVSRGSSNSPDAPFYVAVTGKSSIDYGGGAADTACLRVADNGSNNGYFHGIELRSKRGGDVRLYCQDGGDDISDFVVACDSSGISERLRITSDGKLEMQAAGANSLRIDPNSTAGKAIFTVDPGSNFGSSGYDFRIDGTDSNALMMVIRRGTNPFIGIGRDSQQGNERLTVQQNGTDVCFFTQNSSGTHVTLKLLNKRATASTEGEQIAFFDESGNQRGKIINNISTTTYVTSSDYRLKENQVEISDGIERVKQLKPYKFNWKNRPNLTVDGFFAHEVENIVKDCVSGEKDRVVTQADHDAGDYTDKKIGDELHQMMDNSQIVPLLTAALKEEISKREALEARVATLEGS